MCIVLDAAGIRDEFREVPVDTDVVVGETATLRCRAPRGEPEPRVRWLKDSARLRTTERVLIDSQGVLTLNDVRHEDAGSYVCVASNVADERRSAPAQLRVRGTPPFHHGTTSSSVVSSRVIWTRI